MCEIISSQSEADYARSARAGAELRREFNPPRIWPRGLGRKRRPPRT